MANVIQIKRGTTTPTTTNLPNDGEMAYDKTGKKLYINNGGTIDSIGGVGWSTNTDTKMTQAYSTTSNSYPMLLCATAGISSTSSRGATTGILNNQLYANPNTGLLHATTMEGKGTVAYGSTAPNAANHNFWVDTSTTGSIPAAYGVANNLTTAYSGTYVLDAYQGKLLNDSLSAVVTEIQDIWETIYPVGSIYMSVNSASPETLFGGTWEQIKDRFLLGAGDTYTAGATGGEATHTLSINEMPSHNHRGKIAYNQTGYGYNPNTYEWIIAGGSHSELLLKSGSSQYNNINVHQLAPTDSAGGGQAHNNMPPYLTVYMWKRIA